MTALSNTAVLVLGAASSGVAAARYCARMPEREVASVTLLDSTDSDKTRSAVERLAGERVRVVLGEDSAEGRFDLCIASPGIPPHAPVMRWAKSVCSRMVSEIEFAFEQSHSPWVAITGTNGKTTTTALVAHLLTTAGVPARLVGNIGTPAIEVVADTGESDVLVAEVSSFQLSLTETFHPRVAVLLNVTPDHIDWHGSMEAYSADKAKVFANLGPDDTAVIDIDDPGSARYAGQVSGPAIARVSIDNVTPGGASVVDGALSLEHNGSLQSLVPVDELQIRGSHNVSNALAAAAAAHAMGVGLADIREGLRSFRPIEHRLEPVGEVDGVEWFNDSKATNPDAVLKALTAFDDRPLVLLLGGRNKGNDFGELARAAATHARVVIIFGEAGDDIRHSFGDAPAIEVLQVKGMTEAVAAAARMAVPGEAVLLSPACASFDEFEGYEHRGRTFKAMVAALAGDR